MHLTPAQMKGLAKHLERTTSISSFDTRGLAKKFGEPLIEQLRSARGIPVQEIEGSSNPIQQARLREFVLFALQERAGLIIDYPRPGTSDDDIVKGLRVKARDQSDWSQVKIGTVMKGDSDSRSAMVLFDDGCMEGRTLGFVDRHMCFFDLSELSSIHADAIARASGQSFAGFKEWLVGEVEKKIAECPREGEAAAQSSKLEFRNGTKVEVIRGGDALDLRGYTVIFGKTGGVVVGRVRNDDYAVRLTDEYGRVITCYPIKAQDLKKAAPLDARELVEECARDAIETINKEMEWEIISREFAGLMIESGLLLEENGNLLVNRLRTYELVGDAVAKVYANPRVYSSPDMFSPPSERKPHVLRLELTQGCNYGRCTYCTGYKGIPYKTRSFEEFVAHYDEVAREVGEKEWAKLTDWHSFTKFKRVFIGGANALGVEMDTLEKVLKFLSNTYSGVALYGRTDSILEKGENGLRRLRKAGLGIIYWGIESGAQSVLDYVQKGTTEREQVQAAKAASMAWTYLSVMVMPGLGGIRHSEEHVEKTAFFLNKANPKFITFMAVNPAPDSRYALRMAEEARAGTNRPLTDSEIIAQTYEILARLSANGQKIGMHGIGIDKVGRNPINFNISHDPWSGYRDHAAWSAICWRNAASQREN